MPDIEDKINSLVHSINEKARIFVKLASRGCIYCKDILKGSFSFVIIFPWGAVNAHVMVAYEIFMTVTKQMSQ